MSVVPKRTVKERKLTALGGPEVFAWGRSTGTATASLLNAEGAALDDLALQAFLGRVGLFSSGHVYEAEATRLLGVRVHHDRAVVDIAVLLEQTRNVGFSQTRVDAGDKQVGAGVDGALFIIIQGLAHRGSSGN